MFQALTRFCAVALFWLLGGQSLFAFALLGRLPAGGADAYQQPVLFYQLTTDVGTPKNLGEGYRWNTPKLFYAVDANFFNYFGSNGLKAIDQAFAIMNNLAPVSTYSADLSEWPTATTRINHRAEGVGLLDLKSEILSLLVEQMGLAQPTRWTWCLRERLGPPPGGACPVNMIYDVIKRNFDPVTDEPTSYVNGALYSYTIVEFCNGPNLADAVEFQVDAASENLTALADFGTGIGQFYINLTRDDVGGLRYQWASNRMYVEGVSTNSLLQSPAVPTLIITSNLASLVAATLTNSPAQLQALFPTLQITSSNFLYFSNVITTNITTFFTNVPGSQVGSPATLAQTVTITTNPVPIPIFSYTFGNVITNFVYTNFGVLVTNQVGTLGQVTVQQTTVGTLPGSQVGSPPVTNTTSTTVTSNFVTGEFFIIPTNGCGYTILSNVFTQVTPVTNVLAATNTATNVGVQSFAIVTYFTNHTLAVAIPNCINGSVALREGVEKVSFFNTAFDSYLNAPFVPITNVYTLTAVTNGIPFIQTFQRVIPQPDFLITAQDTTDVSLVGLRSISYNGANVGAGLAGPGNINPPVTFTVNKVGPIFQVPAFFGTLNVFFLPAPVLPPFGEVNHALIYQWGSYDGSTNEPVVYPSGSSILNLEKNVFLQITIAGPLPSGNVAQPYSAQLSVTGANPPFTWAPTNNIYYPNGLPPGLSISPSTGQISGTPTTPGLYDFLVQVTDSTLPTHRVNQRNLQIEIDP